MAVRLIRLKSGTGVRTSDSCRHLLHKGAVNTFKVCKSVHHHTIQINQPTRCNNLSSLLLDVYLQLNMFRAFSCQSSEAQQLQ
jgi:hypothetical protein